MGLHILGQPLEGDLLTDGILQLRLSNDKVPSIYDLWAEKYHTTLDTIQSRSAEVDEEMKCTYGELMSRIRKETKTVIKAVQDGGFTKEAVSKALSLPEAAGEKGGMEG